MIWRRRKLLYLPTFLALCLLCYLGDFHLELQMLTEELESEEGLEPVVTDAILGDGTEERRRNASEFPYKFLIDEPAFCSADLYVVNIMPISVGDFASRSRVRQMWGSRNVVRSTKLRPLFLVGEAEDASQQREILKESSFHRDILQLGFKDTYLNLTLKTLSALHWKQTRCQHVPWLIKSDADVFMNPWSVTDYLRSEKADIVCRMLYSKPVCRPDSCKDKRWVIPLELYPHEYYPPYCNGPVYAVNQKAVRQILSVASTENPFPMEDVYYTGILVQGTDLLHEDLGTRCRTYYFRRAPYEIVRSGKSLFLVGNEKRRKHNFTFEKIWDNLLSPRT